jgi:S-adenosylmethionine decarboxylase
MRGGCPRVALRRLLSCEKKVEIDFHIADPQHDLRRIPRSSIDAFLTLAKCTVISTRNNEHFDSYLLSESSLFIFPTKIILKTCGTTMLLKSVESILVSSDNGGRGGCAVCICRRRADLCAVLT